MKLFDTDSFSEIWATITRNKFRSVATGFGVFWGLFMLIALVAFGNKISQGVMGQLDGFSTNSIFFQPNRTTEAFKGYRKGRYWAFDNRDLYLIRQRAASVDLLSPMLWEGGGDKNVVRGLKSGSYSFNGCLPDFFRINQQNIVAGRLFNEKDNDERRKVCLIGTGVRDALFNPGEEAVGQFIRISGIYFQVIGVISPKSKAVGFGSNRDEMIYLPFDTQQRLFSRGDEFWFLACTTRAGHSADEAEAEVKSILTTAHDISPTDASAIFSMNMERQFSMFTGLLTAVGVIMWMVGLGALLSGIIGISNIMLVTVRERMREIGVRRALGAKPADIIVQIMSESFVLTTIAGIVGFIFGVGASLLIEKLDIMDSAGSVAGDPVVSFSLALVAMAVLVASGIAAGLLPAWRALKIKAIDAIRDE